mmetsp:Transcript_11352/g.36072  ORF Transcript_11352/g.36072 Transcript_11352/m.36072 type:complete len:308 (-) Transcript_11352:532-1455(-)
MRRHRHRTQRRRHPVHQLPASPLPPPSPPPPPPPSLRRTVQHLLPHQRRSPSCRRPPRTIRRRCRGPLPFRKREISTASTTCPATGGTTVHLTWSGQRLRWPVEPAGRSSSAGPPGLPSTPVPPLYSAVSTVVPASPPTRTGHPFDTSPSPRDVAPACGRCAMILPHVVAARRLAVPPSASCCCRCTLACANCPSVAPFLTRSSVPPRWRTTRPRRRSSLSCCPTRTRSDRMRAALVLPTKFLWRSLPPDRPSPLSPARLVLGEPGGGSCPPGSRRCLGRGRLVRHRRLGEHVVLHRRHHLVCLAQR